MFERSELSDMEPDSPYVYRDEDEQRHDRRVGPDPEGREVVIVDGRAMSYRSYRRAAPVSRVDPLS